MRVIIFFDLPTYTGDDKRGYRKFRKYLLCQGFLMEQESVYSKIAVNTTMADSIVDNIKKNKPKDGIVQVLKVTEKQYNRMEYIVGNKKREVIDSDERLVIL